MSDKLYSEESIQAIANSIRAKNGTSETYTVSEMSTAINALPTDLTTKTITENGTYNASSDDADGYSSVTVAVEGYAKKSIANTPTPIATFNASALPMPSLSVGIEAVQDLHGYDSPWVGGAGKNKYEGSPLFDEYVDKNKWTLQAEKYNGHDVYKKSTAWGGMYKLIYLDVGTYTFSCMCKTSDSATVFIFLKIDNVTTSITDVTQISNTSSTSWTKISGTFNVTSAGTVALRVERSSDNDNGDIYISEYQLESGSTPTSYAPYSNICPISGWSAVNRYRTGKNIFDKDNTIIVNDKVRDDNGIEISSSGACYTSSITAVKPNTTYVLNGLPPTPNVSFRIYYLDVNGNWLSRTNTINFNSQPYSFTTPNNCGGLQFQLGKANTDFSATQLELGETATAYEAYNGTTYTTTLKDGQGNPLTCYGGELSNDNGVQRLDNTHNSFDMGSVGWGYTNNRFFTKIDDIWNNAQDGVPTVNQLMCEIYKTVMYTNQPTGTVATWNGYIYVRDYSYSGDATAFKTAVAGYKIAYELATPQTIQQDNLAIATQDGTNNIWADSGDVQSGEYMEAL